MSWFKKNIVNNPILNPAGWVATQIRKDNGGDATDRVNTWAQNAEIVPGCSSKTYVDTLDTTAKNPCTWNGTGADWQAYRRDWINNCTAANNRGVLTSKNKTDAACAAKFDELAKRIQGDIYESNATEYDNIKKLVANNNIFLVVGVLVVVAIVIFLLMKKKK